MLKKTLKTLIISKFKKVTEGRTKWPTDWQMKLLSRVHATKKSVIHFIVIVVLIVLTTFWIQRRETLFCLAMAHVRGHSISPAPLPPLWLPLISEAQIIKFRPILSSFFAQIYSSLPSKAMMVVVLSGRKWSNAEVESNRSSLDNAPNNPGSTFHYGLVFGGIKTK